MVSVTEIELCYSEFIDLNAHLTTSVQCGGIQYNHQVQEINVVFLKNMLRNGNVHSCWSKKTWCFRGGAKCCVCLKMCVLYIKQ